MAIPKTGSVGTFADFTNSNDPNHDDEASIQPWADGEPFRATSLTDCARRPIDNIRQRSEIIRGILDDNFYLNTADRAMGLFESIGGGVTITWNGTVAAGGDGKFIPSGNIYYMPFATVGNNLNTPPVGGSFGTVAIARADATQVILITSKLPSWKGGDRINITVVGGGALNVQIFGTFDIVLTVIDGVTTRLQALNALNGAIGAIAQASNLAGVDADIIMTSQPKAYVEGNWDSETHILSPANIASFFAAGINVLKEGDTLCIQYEDLIEFTPFIGGRRQSTPENLNTLLPAGSYFNSRVDPNRLPNCLCICKVVNNKLWFIDGTIVPMGGVVRLGGVDASSVGYAGGPNWLDGTTNPATTVENQLDKIITDLSVQNTITQDGAAKIGAEGVGALVRGTVRSQLTFLDQDKINGFIYPGFKMWTSNGTTVTLNPFECVINKIHRVVPAANLAALFVGLAKDVWWYLYAFWTGIAVDFEISATAPTSNRKTKTGDVTRTYLGAIILTPVSGQIRRFFKSDRHHQWAREVGTNLDGPSNSKAHNAFVSNASVLVSCNKVVPVGIFWAEIYADISSGPGTNGHIEVNGANLPATTWIYNNIGASTNGLSSQTTGWHSLDGNSQAVGVVSTHADIGINVGVAGFYD